MADLELASVLAVAVGILGMLFTWIGSDKVVARSVAQLPGLRRIVNWRVRETDRESIIKIEILRFANGVLVPVRHLELSQTSEHGLAEKILVDLRNDASITESGTYMVAVRRPYVNPVSVPLNLGDPGSVDLFKRLFSQRWDGLQPA
jgi:hypothetical protein